MMKRFLSIIFLILNICLPITANQEISLKLNSKDNRLVTEPLGFGYINFEYICLTGNTATIRVSVENITQTPPLAILLFRKNKLETNLSRNKPKIEFEKKFPGRKGERAVDGCNEGFEPLFIITPEETDTVFLLNVNTSAPYKLTMPFYIAKYKPKDLLKKGKNNITYKIYEQHLFEFNIEVEGWTEDDPEYTAMKNKVDAFTASLNTISFCDNLKHKASLQNQQQQYINEKNKLIMEISKILDKHSEWMSIDAPSVAYNKLIEQINSIDFNKYIKDCGKHEKKHIVNPKTSSHNCGNCGLTEQQIYHRLDDLFQQVYAGKISKSSAVSKASSLYNCYQNNKARKKSGNYSGKIAERYNRITK